MEEHLITVTRSARYFTWGAFTPRARVAEVWYVLHGYGQLASRFGRHFDRLAGPARLIVAPEGLSRFYVAEGAGRVADRRVGASWMTREDRLAEIADYVAYLDAVYTNVSRRTEGQRPQVTVLGFSQGAAAACRWVAQGVVRPQRLILWGGEVPPDLDFEAGRERFAGLNLTLVIGRHDDFITPKILTRDTERLSAHGVPFRVVHYDGGHEIDEEVLKRLGDVGRET
jgi:predicted esterase